MSFETYKIKSHDKKGQKRLYTLDELHSMELPALRAICRAERIIPESLSVFNDKSETAELIFKCRGTASNPYINKLDPDGIKRLKVAIETRGDVLSEGEVNIPAYFKLYKGMSSTNEKGGEYAAISEVNIGRTNALLIDSKNDIRGIFHVSESTGGNRYLLTLMRHMWDNDLKTGLHKNLSIIFFPKDFDKIVRIYNNAIEKIPPFSYIRASIRELSVHEPEETDDVLVIDYGTSYTTAGTYSDGKIKLARFYSGEMCERNPEVPAFLANCQNCGRCELCPSVVAVKNCASDHIEFLYGYEAKSRLSVSRNSIFFDTKRWVNNYKEVIEVTDFNGYTASIERGAIIEMFLKYIISVAEQQNKKRYKNICFTSPVKQKALSVGMYRDILKGYNVAIKDAIDEAVAVVYESVAGEVERFKYKSGEKEIILLIDCGGGTSDMIKCDYIINSGASRSDINITVAYANGDTNFGGNNLTYRIMQYIKIKLAQYYSGQNIQSADTLLGISSADIYDFIDTHGAGRLYRQFEEAYARAENVIPTAFDGYRNEAEFIYLDVRGNFYFLWNLAERIKVEFYNHIGAYEFSFARLKSPDTGAPAAGYAISVKNGNGELETHTLCPPISISRDEINLLIKPEIYGLLKNFIEQYYKDGTLRYVTKIKLSGQTTKVDIFRDVLKEYIEGHKARVPFESSFSKKLRCINGAIAYYSAKMMGRINAYIEYESAAVPYKLTAEVFNQEEREKTLIQWGQKLSDIYGFVDRTIETRVIVLDLKDQSGRTLHQKKVNMSVSNFKQVSYEELLSRYTVFQEGENPGERQGDLDRITNDIVRIFIFSDDDSWGFKLIGVSRFQGQLCCSGAEYYPFENTEWEMNFFDGKR